MWLDHGEVSAIGEPADVLERYERHAREISLAAALRLGNLPSTDEDILIQSATCFDLVGQPQTRFEFEEPFEIRIEFQTSKEIVNPFFLLQFTKGNFAAIHFSTISMIADGTQLGPVNGKGVISCLIKNPCMTPGEYGILVGAQKYITLLQGKKYYATPRLLSRFEIKKDRFLELFPSVPTFQLGTLAPVAFDYEWHHQ
jgi:hypothetical protein